MMSKFNSTRILGGVRSPVRSETTASGHTYEGSAGYARDTRSELFLLAVSNMVGENTFYETGAERDDRYEKLVRQATTDDPEWTVRFLRWLRGEANMRTAAIVGAAAFAKERVLRQQPGMSRQAIDAVLQRADEPGELVAYWRSVYGRALPKPVKRGVADAITRLYGERSLIKQDSAARDYRFADVLELCHPKPKDQRQDALFSHIVDRRFNPDGEIPAELGVLRARDELLATPVDQRRDVLARNDVRDVLARAGMTWESLAGWLQGPLDAAAWQAVIPSMGYMALLRNLRNFDEAGVSDEVAAQVAAKLSDPEQVARSRQFPMRLLSAYRAAPSLRWSYALEQALSLSLRHVPTLDGRTLILVDTSYSMNGPFSKDGTLLRWDAATLFGLALASRCQKADVVSFSGGDRVPRCFGSGVASRC